jgi:hypothetical protein
MTVTGRGSPPKGSDRIRSIVLTATCLVLAGATWAVWFAWDTLRDVDPATGDTSGPYEVWQGGGAAVTLLVLVVLFVRRLAVVDVVLAVSCGFTAGFAYSAAIDPEADGLYVVGAGLLLVVMLVATTLLALAARFVLRRQRSTTS